jgi:hypothetical protein
MRSFGGFEQAVKDFREDIRKTRVVLIRWMFFLWVSHIVIMAFLFLVFLEE